MALIKAEFLHLDGRRVNETIIGVCGTGIVIQQEEYAIKIPRISRDIERDGVPVTCDEATLMDDSDEEHPHLTSIDAEKAIYQRLGNHPGIVRCYNLSSTQHDPDGANEKWRSSAFS